MILILLIVEPLAILPIVDWQFCNLKEVFACPPIAYCPSPIAPHLLQLFPLPIRYSKAILTATPLVTC